MIKPPGSYEGFNFMMTDVIAEMNYSNRLFWKTFCSTIFSLKISILSPDFYRATLLCSI